MLCTLQCFLVMYNLSCVMKITKLHLLAISTVYRDSYADSGYMLCQAKKKRRALDMLYTPAMEHYRVGIIAIVAPT